MAAFVGYIVQANGIHFGFPLQQGGENAQYAAGLQPYIVSGSLYLLLVPALPIAELDTMYPDLAPPGTDGHRARRATLSSESTSPCGAR